MTFWLLDAKRVPFWLYIPNLIGYIRVLTMLLAMFEQDSGSMFATRCLFVSLALDFIDGPLACAAYPQPTAAPQLAPSATRARVECVEARSAGGG